MRTSDHLVARLVLVVVLPPLSVFWTDGFGGRFWLNVLLTVLGYVPGLAHAVWLFRNQ